MILIRPLICTSDEDIAVVIKHLVVHKLGREHLFLIHCHLSLSHDDTRLLSHLNVQLEDLFVELLNHCDIGLFKVSNAELE